MRRTTKFWWLTFASAANLCGYLASTVKGDTTAKTTRSVENNAEVTSKWWLKGCWPCVWVNLSRT